MHGQHYSARELFPQEAACINQANCPCAMITDYDAFLRVTEDGHIWWLLEDAIRLGAGYLPVRDDHQMLATKLWAPSNRAQMNERTLIGAFGDSRLTIERPMTFERDGFRYVDAEGFISWLSQYITQTQSEIAFPAELESEIKVAIAKAAASQPPYNCKEFESLTLALEGWFDKELDALPKALSLRVEQEFFPMPWDELSSKQRQSLALQIDFQHDPATEQERHYWWNFFVRLKELRTQLQQWKSVATPTASDLLRKESRLKELQQKIEQMESQPRQTRGGYYPGRNNPDGDMGVASTADCIAYPKAMKVLSERWQATPEELVAWIFLGPENGGIAAYLNANELNPPPRFYFTYDMGENHLAPLMSCWFIRDEIERFEPTERYITGAALIKRWSKQPGLQPEAFSVAKIAESRLFGIHPTYGLTQGTFNNDPTFPPLLAGLFAVSEIERIEREDGLDSSTASAKYGAVHYRTEKKGGRPKGPLNEAIELAYHHFRDKGDVAILAAGNIRSFMKSFASLVNEEIPLEELGKRKINNAICERIKKVHVPRAGNCSVTTHERVDGRITLHGETYDQGVVSKILSGLRKKHSLPS